MKISDDEDDEPLNESKENVQKETNKTEAASEKDTIENVTALEETRELEKSTEPTVVTSAAPETPSNVEKPTDGDDAVVILTPEQTNTEGTILKIVYINKYESQNVLVSAKLESHSTYSVNFSFNIFAK